MTVIGLDDTDSRELGMCTTYVATRLIEALEADGVTVDRALLVRLHPAIEHKTRGNAALAVHCDADISSARETVKSVLSLAATADDNTNPGVVIADCPSTAVSEPVTEFAARAVLQRCSIDRAAECCRTAGYETITRGSGRGIVGALAATGAWAAFDEWTYECISYRNRERWGTDRAVDRPSVFEAAEDAYPVVWDTVDRVEDTAVCVPRTPGPVLHGIRGDDPEAVQRVAEQIQSEPVERRQLFITNQGTDAHLQNTALSTASENGCYRLDATVCSQPETREGGHVFFTLGSVEEDADTTVTSANGGAKPKIDGRVVPEEHGRVSPGRDGRVDTGGDESIGSGGDGRVVSESDKVSGGAESTIQAAAFEPTKRFRDRVRSLQPGDTITACGELSDGTLKLEKFALRDHIEVELTTPTCPKCNRSMSSAGSDAGYRCRRCGTTADGKVYRPVDRNLEPGWYEVPPCARRHVAKPLVRGGFDAPTYPER